MTGRRLRIAAGRAVGNYWNCCEECSNRRTCVNHHRLGMDIIILLLVPCYKNKPPPGSLTPNGLQLLSSFYIDSSVENYNREALHIFVTNFKTDQHSNGILGELGLPAFKKRTQTCFIIFFLCFDNKDPNGPLNSPPLSHWILNYFWSTIFQIYVMHDFAYKFTWLVLQETANQKTGKHIDYRQDVLIIISVV